ncbi:MAG: hypothetical protein U9Q90_06445 [Campylobacterota bacterium]|nr:hypothetical protein [Campylobacterota bacterium]
MRTIFAIIGIIAVAYYLFRGLTSNRKASDPLISDAEVGRSATGIMTTLDTLSDKSLNATMAELDGYGIGYEWEPWGKIIWQLPEVPNITFEKDKTSVAAYSMSDSLGGLYVRIWSIVDSDRVISDASGSKISIRLESPASNYERLVYAKLIEMGAEIIKGTPDTYGDNK